MKKIILFLSISIPTICSAQFNISLIGEDTLCIGQISQYSVEVNEFPNHYLFRDTSGLSSGGNGFKALDAGYDFLDVTNTFTYDLWVKPTRTIDMKGESNACAGDVSVPLAFTDQNWALVPVGLGEGRMSVGLTIGTNGLMVGEHSGNILVSRLSHTTAINDWVHVAIVYRTDSIFLYLDGKKVRSRSIHCPSNTKCVTSGLTGYYYSPDFTGNIDEFRMWDFAMTGEQIHYIKDKKLNDEVSGLRYYASFDNGKFERTAGDLGTFQITVNQIVPEKYIKKSSWQLNSYSGADISGLTPFSADDFTYSWSTGDITQNTTFTLVDEGEVISIEVSNDSFYKKDSMLVRGIDCCQDIYYDTVIVYDTIHGPILPSEGLVAYYPFNGNANDESGNGYNGDVTGATPAPDRFGNENSAFSFDRENDYIHVPNSVDMVKGDEEMTVSFWAYFKRDESNQHIIGNFTSYNYAQYRDWGFYSIDNSFGGSFNHQDDVDVRVGYSVYHTSHNEIVLNQWEHITIVYDRYSSKVYVNGEKTWEEEAPVKPFTVGNNFDLMIGASRPNDNYTFEGMLDDIRIYNRALDSTEVLSLNKEVPGSGIVFDTIITEIFDTTYIEVYDTLGNNTAQFFQRFEKEEESFSTSIDVSGKLAVVSAGWENTVHGSESGAAYIYEFNGTEWLEKQRLISPFGRIDGIFGHNVATDGKTIIVTEPNAEQVHVYSKTMDLWEHDTSFTVTGNSSEKFGISAAVDGNTFVVGSGAVFATLCNAVGSVYVFEKLDGNWNNTEILVAEGASAHDNFGADVSIDDDVIAVGADNDECYAGGEGYVCIFQKEANGWNEIQKITAPDGTPGNRFGKSVDIENNRLIINGHGGTIESAYYYEKENDWMFKYQFKNTGNRVNYGWPVCLNEDLVIIGAHHDSEIVESNGAIYIYRGSGSDFKQLAKIFPENPDQQTKFAYGNLHSDGNFLFSNGGYHQARVDIFQLSEKYFEFTDTVRMEIIDTSFVTIYDTLQVREDILNARYLKFESYYSEDNSQVNVYDISAWSDGYNVASNKPSEVSSCEGGGEGNCGSSAVDDNDSTRWSSERNAEGPDKENPHYIIVDMTNEYDLDSVRLNIEGFDSWKQDFSISYSSDREEWITIGKGIDTTGIFTYYSSGGTAKTYYDTVRVTVYDTSHVTYVDTVSEFYQEGLISHYTFDGDARDMGTRKKDGIVKGAVLTTDRKGNEYSAYYFDGVDDYIEIPGELAITNTFSIAFWAKSENRSGTSNIICDGSSSAGGNDFLLNFRGNDIGVRADKSGGQLNLEYSSPVSLQNLNLVDEWVHVVWVMKPDGSRIYVNGIEKAEIDIPGSNMGYHDDFSYIGARNVWDRCDNFFKGKLDDIRIYNLALREPQVRGIYEEKNVEIDTVATIYERVSVTDTLIIDAVLTGYEAPFNINTIKVYPNPAKDHIFINTGNYSQMKGYRLNIINQLGSSVFETMVNEALYQINLSTWTGKGLYFMQIIDRKGQIIDIRKIIIQ